MKKHQIKIFDFASQKETGTKDLPPEIFGIEDNPKIVSEVVKVFLANQRNSRAKALTRSEVSGSGKKIWRQKGTGRARHGDRYAPIFVGGGVTHGPTGKENWSLSLPQKKRARALAVSLSRKLKRGELIFVKNLSQVEGKTKPFLADLKALLKSSLNFEAKELPKVTVVSTENNPKLTLALKNLQKINQIAAENLNSYQVLTSKYLVIEEDSVKKISARVSKVK